MTLNSKRRAPFQRRIAAAVKVARATGHISLTDGRSGLCNKGDREDGEDCDYEQKRDARALHPRLMMHFVWNPLFLQVDGV
jgi:hypothetical protein